MAARRAAAVGAAAVAVQVGRFASRDRAEETHTLSTAVQQFFMFDALLRVNPKCATCLKDLSEAHAAWAESSDAPRHLADAEAALRRALDLLPSDSDALFSLGVVLSKRGDDAGALAAYEASADVNADDVELLYNLAVKLGEAGRRGDEAAMYERALAADPTFARSYLSLIHISEPTRPY